MLQLDPSLANPFDEHGPGLTGGRATIAHARIKLLVRLLTIAELPQLVARWHDDKRKTASGRKRTLSDTALIVVLLCLAVEGLPMHLTLAAEILADRLTAESRSLLGLPEKLSRAQAYDLAQNAFTRLVKLMDPKPAKYHRRMTMEEKEANEAKRDPEESKFASERLMRFCNDLLYASTAGDPSILHGWEGNVTIDATAIAVFSKRGQNKAKLFASIEPDAGWYRRDSNHDVTDDPKKARVSFFGYEMHLVAPANNTDRRITNNGRKDPAKDFCRPVIGISWTAPSIGPSKFGFRAIAGAYDRFSDYMRGGLVVADRGYFASADPEVLQLPVRALGMGILTDYKVDQLGVNGGYAGAEQIEGHYYCPAMPDGLKNATADRRADIIDWETWRHRIDARGAYVFRRKERPDDDGWTPMMCPASGPNATASCTLKPKDAARNAGKTLQPILHSLLPSHPDKVCTQQTVQFPPSADAKYLQDVRYGTKAWSTLYTTARNYIESVNAFLKDEGTHALAVAGRRRVRGHSKQFILTTMIIFAANLRRANTYKWERVNIVEPSRRRRRDVLNNYNYDPLTGRGEKPTFVADGYDLLEADIIDNQELATE